VVITFYIETALRRMRPWNSLYMCTCNALPSIAFTFKVLLVRADRLNLSTAQQQHLALGERKQTKGRGLGGCPWPTKDIRHKQNDSTESPSISE
jgi:hypothetical protein